MSKIFIRVLINSLIGVILIIVWLQFVDINELIKVLQTVELKFLSAFFIFFLVSTSLRTLRLRVLLHEFKLEYKNLFSLNLLSQLLSFLIPLRVGELTKSIYLSTKLNLSLPKTVVWVFIDRFLDFWVDLLIIGTLIYIVPNRLPLNLAQIIFSSLLVFSILPVIIIKSSNLSKKLLVFSSHLLIFTKIKSTFIKSTHAIIDGFEILKRNPLELIVLMVITSLASVSDSMVWYFILLSLGVKIEFLTNLLGSLLTALTFLIPSAPGYVGSAEAAGLAVFGGFIGINPTVASAAAVINHVLAIMALLLTGIPALYLLKFNLNLVWKKLIKRD